MFIGLIGSGFAAQVTISGTADTDDATLYSNDTLGNAGADLAIRAGQSRLGYLHRALIRFNLNSIASTASINSVALVLTITHVPIGGVPATHSLYRVTNTWSEGTGIGTGAGGGAGGQIIDGAVCWSFAQYSTLAWTNDGGDYSGSPSAATMVSVTLGDTTFWSSEGMVSDVQSWVNGSQVNNGWILIGDESVLQSARGFSSSENSGSPPQLIVDYTTVIPAAVLSEWKLY